MRSVCLALSVVVCASGAGVWAEQQVAVEPEILFQEEGVLVTGLTPGGAVAWFGISRESHDGAARVVRRDGIVVAEEGERGVSLELEGAVAFNSVWVAVDLASGALAVAAPEGSRFHEVALPPRAIRPGAAGVDSLADGREFLEVFLVRPQVGAWRGSVGDGGIDDQSTAGNREVLLRLTSLTPIGGSAELTPTVFRPGDVVVAVDPHLLELYAVKLVVPSS